MIERIENYYVGRCDGKCLWQIGWDLEHPNGFRLKRSLIKVLKKEGWQRRGNKWFCPNCQKEKK